MKQNLLVSLDCTREYGADQFFACGTSRVVEGVAGRYREAEPKPPSRFGYRFRIQHVGRPHLAVIRYPDDRRRFMTVYDDTTAALYEQETGVRVPVDPKAPDRFSKRHAFLTADSRRAAWVDWRCRKVRNLIRRMRDALTADRPDLTLTLNLWNEVPAGQRYGNGHPGAQIYARPNGKTMYREYYPIQDGRTVQPRDGRSAWGDRRGRPNGRRHRRGRPS